MTGCASEVTVYQNDGRPESQGHLVIDSDNHDISPAPQIDTANQISAVADSVLRSYSNNSCPDQIPPSNDRIAVPLNKEGNKVSMQDAFDAWQPHAVAMLTETAKRYNDFVTYSQLAEFVQVQTGITHKGLVMNWIGDVLGRVISVCTSNGWPQLTSLCVTSDGTVGAGYKFAVLAAVGASSGEEHERDPQSLDDLDEHAARTRLECYRFFGADLPPDGGKPTLTPKAQAKKEYKKAQAKLDAPLKFCSKCNEALPMTGQCDNCD